MSSSRWVVTTPSPAPVTPEGVEDPPLGDSGEELGWVGAHGGAGTTTLRDAAGVGRDCGRVWPSPPTGPVLLVARTHASGLGAARRLLREHGSQSVRGLVLVADAPGRLPRPLRQQVRVLSGAVPRLWQVPWVETWRVDPRAVPDRHITRLLSRLTDHP